MTTKLGTEQQSRVLNNKVGNWTTKSDTDFIRIEKKHRQTPMLFDVRCC
ncbi:TPA: hypothetical protein QC364_005731 [Bacillus cereus]|nr:hypothetical protein [Bacillus cereus]HDX9601042.1 hypothetical protein [Bacillus cereus]HDX9676673.1 hypothetical protein [Bacillus cereus]